jgi:hypothetical protein
MGNYSLQANEVVIMRVDQVTHKKSTFSFENGELILTNLYLVWNAKKMFGMAKNTQQQYPLHSIKVFNGKAQVTFEKKSGGKPRLTIFFKDGQASFEFTNKSQDEVKTIANSINHTVTGTAENIYEVRNNSIPGVAKAAEALKGTVDVFKDAFGVKHSEKNETLNEKVAKKCSSCSAPISGMKGHVVHCDYCDTDQQL